MTQNRYAKERTALLFVDPHNDFLGLNGPNFADAILTTNGLADALRRNRVAASHIGTE